MLDVMTSIMMLLAGVGVFMAGMKMMGDGLERSAGKGIKKLLGKFSNNRFAGVGVGLTVTAIVQSSSATSVMVIGFVNAGLMTLFQATAILMGANVGTTVTGILVSFSAFKINMYLAALAIVGVFMMMFSKNEKVGKVGGILCGLGLIFSGLYLMSNSFSGDGGVVIKAAFEKMFGAISFPLLLILLGMLFTAIVQSSSAVTGLIITMVGQSVLGFESAMFIILGTNIGTCITAILASIGASVNAKRTALIHLTFNVIGTIFFTVFIWVFSDFFVWLFARLFSSPQMQVAWFHVTFNVVTTLLLLPFIKQLTRFASWLVKDKADDMDQLKLYYIDDRILHTPPIAAAQVKKEVVNMASIAGDNLGRAMNAIFNRDLSEKERVLKDEERIDFINKGVGRYLIKIASLPLSTSDERFIGSLHHVISDIERVGDHAENFIEAAQEMIENGIVFTDEAMGELRDMYKAVSQLFDLAMDVFKTRDISRLSDVASIEAETDVLKKILLNNHIRRLNAGECSVESGAQFNAIVTALERVADHLTNVAFSIRSPSGSQIEAMQKIAKASAKSKAKE